MKLGSKHIKILGALAALWLGVFAVSDASADSLNSSKTFKLNYFAKQSSWMPSALSPTGSQDALVMGVLSLPGAVTWADYETWGEKNARWSGVGEQVTAYRKVMDANLKMLKRIINEPELKGLLNGLQSENVLHDGDMVAAVRDNTKHAMIRVVNRTPEKPQPKNDEPVIDDNVALPKDDEPPCASNC